MSFAGAAGILGAAALAGCGEAQIVEKEVVKIVTKEVPVEKIVTQIVEKEKIVEKPVEKIVEKIVTQIVEKEKIVEVTPKAPAAAQTYRALLPAPRRAPPIKIEVEWSPKEVLPAQYVVFEKLKARFEQDFPGVTVEAAVLPPGGVAVMTQRIRDARGPDVYNIGHAWTEFNVPESKWKADVMHDLTGAMNELSYDVKDTSWKDTLTPAALSDMAYNGRIWEAPHSTSIYLMLYNKGVLQKAGVSAPPKTWPEFLAACEKIKATGIQPIAPSADFTFWEMWWLFLALRTIPTQTVIDAHLGQKGQRFNTEPFLNVTKMVMETIDKGYFGPKPLASDAGTALQLLVQGKAGFFMDGSWSALPRDWPAGFEMGAMNFPAVPDGKGVSTIVQGNTNGRGVMKYSKAPDVAANWLRLFNSVEFTNIRLNEGKQGFIPAIKGVEVPKEFGALSEAYQVFAGSERVVVWDLGVYAVPGGDAFFRQILKAFNPLVSKEQAPDKWLAGFDKMTNDYWTEYRKSS